MISIVIPHRNQKDHLKQLLTNVSHSEHKNFEVIIVDDASNHYNIIDDVLCEYNFNIKYIKIRDDQRWWNENTCIPANIGFDVASGEIIIFQSASCLYVGDIINDTYTSIKNNFISYACYHLGEKDTRKYLNGCSIEYRNIPFCETTSDDSCWLNNANLCPTGLSGCYASTRQIWKMIRVFDFDYMDGIGSDNLDLIDKVKSEGISIDISNSTNRPHVICLYYRPDVSDEEFCQKVYHNYHTCIKKRENRTKYEVLRNKLGIPARPIANL